MVYVFWRSNYKISIFFLKILQNIHIQFQRYICSNLCQDMILPQKHAIYILLTWAKFYENPKTDNIDISSIGQF